MRYVITDAALANGSFSGNNLEFYGSDMVAGHYVTFKAMGEIFTFTLSISPVGGFDLPVALPGEDRFDWSSRCFDYIEQNCPLTEHYNILYHAQYSIIEFTSKTEGSQYDFIFTEGLSQYFTVVCVNHGRDNDIVVGMLMQIYHCPEPDVAGVLIGEDYKPLEADGSVRFQVQEYVYSHLLAAPHPRFHNELESGIHHTYTDSVMCYRVYFTNKIDGKFEERSYPDLYRYAIPGGLARHDLVKNNTAGIDYFSLEENQKKFMTWLPSGKSKITDQQSRESLYFIFQDPEYSKYKLKADLFTDQGESETVDLMTAYDITPWSVVEFLVGFSTLPSIFQSGHIIKWTVYLVNEDDDVISDEFTFEIDDRYSEYTRYFRFRNSLGAYDTLRCTGAFETNLEHEIEKVSFISDEIETPFNASGSNTINRETLTFTANSGWVSKEFLLYLRDFRRSLDFYELVNSHIFKCVFTSKKTKLLEDKNNNYALSFEYERGWDDEFYSNT